MNDPRDKSASDREASLDEALAESFPASDPVAVGRTEHAGAPRDHDAAPAGTGLAPVVDRPENHRFELAVDGEIAAAYYRIEDGRVVLTHTEVPQRLSGRGVGSHLARGVFDLLRASGRRVIARCPFMAAYAARHTEYQSLIDG